MISTDHPSSASQIVRYGFPSILMSPLGLPALSAADQTAIAGQQHYSNITPAIYQMNGSFGAVPVSLAVSGAPQIVPALQSEFENLGTADLCVEIIRHFFPCITGAVRAGGKQPCQDALQLFLICGTEPVRTVDFQALGMIRNPHYLHSVVPRSINNAEIMGNNGSVADLFP
jgi:hypothetical protein